VNIAPSFSTYLDLVRAACAIAVVFHHYSKHIVRAFPRVFPDVGQEAVMVFFVLSGFVIAHVARRSENDPVVFATKRLARVYPVAIAGVVLSYALYALCAPLDPGLYADRVSPHPWWHEVGLTLTFLNQSLWFPHVMPPTNGPYWSLTCEIWFYVLARSCSSPRCGGRCSPSSSPSRCSARRSCCSSPCGSSGSAPNASATGRAYRARPPGRSRS
jgi:peptidoglycan/LPS O-acetylase OafA/YrhL